MQSTGLITRSAQAAETAQNARVRTLSAPATVVLRSLRLRVLASVLVATAALFAIFGVAIYWAVQSFLYAEFDRGLLTKAQALAGICEQTKGQIKVEFEPS